MVGYVFFPAADAAQDRIWSDTVMRWSEEQAVIYIKGLHAHLHRLSTTPSLWRRLPGNLAVPKDLNIESYFSRYERHFVFFRPLPSGKIGVMSILHERMDLPSRLFEDLSRLSGDGS